MSFQNYLHEKAEESRHNETLAYIVFLTGAIFFVSGILATLSFSRNPKWFLIIPYYTDLSAATFLQLTLMTCGICLIIFGVASGINHSHSRGWYMEELSKANALEEKTTKKTAKNEPKKQKT